MERVRLVEVRREREGLVLQGKKDLEKGQFKREWGEERRGGRTKRAEAHELEIRRARTTERREI